MQAVDIVPLRRKLYCGALQRSERSKIMKLKIQRGIYDF
jgi:hypothetical protein